MLGDVYSDRDDETSSAGRVPAPPADRAPSPAGSRPRTIRRGSAMPDWADEGVLDAAFANWVPGPPASAPAAERSILTDLATRAETIAAQDAAAARAAETTVNEPVPGAATEVVPVVNAMPAATMRWRNEMDDILPAKRKSR